MCRLIIVLQSIEYIYMHSLPIKETEIVDYFLGGYVAPSRTLSPRAFSFFCDEAARVGVCALFCVGHTTLTAHLSGLCLCSADGGGLKDEVMKIAPVQKQTKAGQRTRFRVRLMHDVCSTQLCYKTLDVPDTFELR